MSIKREQFVGEIIHILTEIQNTLFQRALTFRETHTTRIDDRKSFEDYFTPQNKEKPEIHGGFALSHWCGSGDCELKIKDDLGATIRSILLHGDKEDGKCIYCEGASNQRVVFAKAY